jgi:hypothetical protein
VYYPKLALKAISDGKEKCGDTDCVNRDILSANLQPMTFKPATCYWIGYLIATADLTFPHL